MSVTAQASGSQTATISTEHFLANVAIAGTFTLHVDTNAMALLDVVEFRIYQMVLTGGTARPAYFQTYSNVQAADDKVKISVPISNELTDSQALRFSLKQTAGTGRAFPWKILRYA